MIFSKKFFHFLNSLLFVLLSCPVFTYAQQYACVVIKESPGYCRVYDSGIGWRELPCASDSRCSAWRSVEDFPQRLCIQDDHDKRYCHVMGAEGSNYVPCSSDSLCSQYHSSYTPFEDFSTNNEDSNLFDRAKRSFREMDMRREQMVGEIFRRMDIIQEESIRHYVRTESQKTSDVFYEKFEKMSNELSSSKTINELFSSKMSDREWLEKANQIAEQIPKFITDYVINETKFQALVNNGFLSADAVNAWINGMIGVVEKRLYEEVSNFRYKVLEIRRGHQLERLFSYPPANMTNSDLIKRVGQIIDEVEERVRWVDKNPIPALKHLYTKEKYILLDARKIQKNLLKKATSLARIYIFRPSKNRLSENINSLNQILAQIKPPVHIDTVNQRGGAFPDFGEGIYYNRENTKLVHDILKSKYDRRTLGLIDDEELSKPDEEPYQFQSPEGEFLEEIKELYFELYSANPFHEQGIGAREIGLSAVEVADQEYAQGNKETASAAFQVAEAASDITLGAIPYVGLGKDVYEAFTGKHLLTGRTLTDLERALAFAGIAISVGSGGMFSSGALKLADDVFRKVNGKLVREAVQTLKGSQLEKVVQEYPQAFFRSIREVGFTTKKEFQSSVHFLRRAFSKENPSLNEVVETIESVNKSGIKNYTEALDELKAVKGLNLPRAAEEFLASQMRFSRDIIGEQFSRADMARMGKTYSNYYKNMDEVKPVQFSGKVWRGLEKTGVDRSGRSFVNQSSDVFKFHPGIKHSNRRYSAPGNSSIYGSLSRATAKKEVRINYLRSAGKLIDGQNLDKWFHFDSKMVKMDKVLDLTNPNVLKQISKNSDSPLTKGLIIGDISRFPKAYEPTHIIGDVAKRKGFQAIKAPSAQDVKAGGENIVSFAGFK